MNTLTNQQDKRLLPNPIVDKKMEARREQHRDDKPVDLSSSSSSDANGASKKSTQMSEPYVSTSGLRSKPVQTVFPTVNCLQDGSENKIQNCEPASENADRSTRNLIPLGFVPFLLNNSTNVAANSVDKSKSASIRTEQVAAFAENVRLVHRLRTNENHREPPPQSFKTHFYGHHEPFLMTKEDGAVTVLIRGEKNVVKPERREAKFIVHEPDRREAKFIVHEPDRREAKFIVHEPERPGDAVNHHFSKSLQVRHPIGPQPTFVPGVMINPQSFCETNNKMMTLQNSAAFNSHIKPTGSRSTHNLESNPFLYSVTKPSSCSPNTSSIDHNSDFLKPTLDLSGNVYLPSTLKTTPEALLSKIQQDQLQEYLKLQVQQLQHLQQHNVRLVQNQTFDVSSREKRPVDKEFYDLTNPSHHLLEASSVCSKVDLSSGVLDLQKKQNFPSAANSISMYDRPTPPVQFWSDKVSMQDRQALLSNSIIVLDCLEGIDHSLLNQLTPQNSFNILSGNRSSSVNSMQSETSVITRVKKRTSEEALPLVNNKKPKVADRLMDVTSLLFCGSEREVTSPQLGFLPHSSSLNLNHQLQNCFRVVTPDVPSISSNKEGRFSSNVYAEGGSMDRGVFKQEDAKTERPIALRVTRDGMDTKESSQTVTDCNIKSETTPLHFASITSKHPPPLDVLICEPPSNTMKNNLPPILSSMKSSPDSPRDNNVGTDSETRSACSPLMIRSIGGTPTFASSSEANDSSVAVRSLSVCSSKAPMKFKKAWLKRYDEDSRNDSNSSTENISPNGRTKCADANDGDVVKKEVITPKSFDALHHQDTMTPSTSAVEDSNDAWTSENEDEGKIVTGHQNGTDDQNSSALEPRPSENSETTRYECIDKMRGRLRELRVASKRDDPSAVLSSQVLNHISKEKRSESLESFLQDGSCHEVTPRLIKCRECRAIKNKKDRKAPNDFCRFYAFRRLRYVTKRHLSVSGFSDLNDVTVPDMELWFPTLPIVGPLLDQQVASYLLAHLHESFSKIVKVERMAETWCRKSISIDVGGSETVWKRAVQGVKEMCDVCDVALFNMHCVCNKCGFAVCISCHKEKIFQMKKMKMLTSGNNSDDERVDRINQDSKVEAVKMKRFKSDSNGPKSCEEEPADRWLTCHNKHQLHDPHKLMVAHTIPSDVLWYLEGLLEKYLKTQTSSGTPPNSLPFLSSAFDRLAVLADVAERQIQQDENQVDNKSQTPQASQQILQNSPFIGVRKLQEAILKGKDIDGLGVTANGTKFQGKCMTMLQKDRLLHVTDATLAISNLFLSSFQEHWSKGLPIVASKCNLDIDLWRPDLLYRTLARSDPNHLESFVDAVACRRFWEGFEKVSARVKHNRYGLSTTDAMLSPVFTWGSSKDEFRDTLPNQFKNLMESLPIRPYTSDNGHFNLTSRLPDFFAKPDLGPHLKVGYGQLDMFEGSLPLKLEGCDVITLLACVITPKDDVSNHLSAAEKYLMKIGCGLKLSDTATKPGVVWHVFERQYNDIIEKLIVEKQMKANQSNVNSLEKKPIYLNVEDLKLLKREKCIEPITIVQHLDDAVFIPAGCYHQARFLYGCVMTSMDVVTPENTSFMFNHQLEANFNCSDKLQLLNTIYHATKDSLAVAMQSEMLGYCH